MRVRVLFLTSSSYITQTKNQLAKQTSIRLTPLEAHPIQDLHCLTQPVFLTKAINHQVIMFDNFLSLIILSSNPNADAAHPPLHNPSIREL
jgi:hypothetical protein